MMECTAIGARSIYAFSAFLFIIKIGHRRLSQILERTLE